MNYKGYLKSLAKNIRGVSKAVNEGAILSQREEFDLMFKKELLRVAKGKGTGVLGFLKSIKDEEYRVAKLYAEYFDRIMDVYEDGYSLGEVKSLFGDLLLEAWVKKISDGKYSMDCRDRNGVIHLTLVVDSQEVAFLEIDSVVTCVETMLAVLGFMGCDVVEDMDEADFYEDYLFNEHSRICNGLSSKPYVDKVKSFKELKDVLVEDCEREVGKIIEFKVG